MHAHNQSLKQPVKMSSNPALKRHHSTAAAEERVHGTNTTFSMTRRSLRYANPSSQYETPDEEDELLDEAITSAHTAAKRLDAGSYQPSRPQVHHVTSDPGYHPAYLTPSPSKDMNGVNFGAHDYSPTMPVDIPPRPPPKNNINPQWPTPPYDENDWASMAAASIIATQAAYR